MNQSKMPKFKVTIDNVALAAHPIIKQYLEAIEEEFNSHEELTQSLLVAIGTVALEGFKS